MLVCVTDSTVLPRVIAVRVVPELLLIASATRHLDGDGKRQRPERRSPQGQERSAA